MSRRHKVHLEDEAEESGELNLVPYLDIITTLVIFLIFTFQVIIEFRLIDLLPPAYSGANANPNPDEKPPLTLSLLIMNEGYRLVTSDNTLGASDVPKKNGQYDTAGLNQKLYDIKKNLKLGESLMLTAADDIEYKHVVAAMDAARKYKDNLLFPDVLLSKADLGGGG
jgi:biopolymer transport protein ExbD